MNKILEEIRQNKQRLLKLQETMNAENKRLFGDGCKEIFAKHPRLKSFGFTAYTPYFNDGSSCEYSAHTSYPIINEIDEQEDWSECKTTTSDKGENLFDLARDCDFVKNESSGQWERLDKIPEKEAKEIVDTVKEFLGSFDDDFWLNLVGDHVKVKITESGIETEECNHD